MYEITMKNANGEIKTITTDKYATMNDTLFEKIKDATRKAGHGELMSYKYVDGRTDAEKAAHALNDKIAKCEIDLAKARDNDPQAACKLRDELEALKEQRRDLK